MYILSKPAVISMFKEEVQSFLDTQDIVYTPQFISKGKIGLEFTFDFQIAYKQKEIIIKSFSKLDKSNIPSFLFTRDDIKSVREQITGKELTTIAIINDEKEILPEYLEALAIKKADYILWSERLKDKNINKLKSAA
jgi:hypothetical protein